jgi:hypothetical protein
MREGSDGEGEARRSSSKSKLPRDSGNRKIPINKHLHRLVLIYVMQIWFLQGVKSEVPPQLLKKKEFDTHALNIC